MTQLAQPFPTPASQSRNQATGESHTVVTDSAGLYSLPSLQPGSYRIEVKASGLESQVVNQLTVAVGSTATQNFKLNVASSNQVVEVNSPPLWSRQVPCLSARW